MHIILGGVLGGAWGLLAVWLTRGAPWFVTIAAAVLGAALCGFLAARLTR